MRIATGIFFINNFLLPGSAFVPLDCSSKRCFYDGYHQHHHQRRTIGNTNSIDQQRLFLFNWGGGDKESDSSGKENDDDNDDDNTNKNKKDDDDGSSLSSSLQADKERLEAIIMGAGSSSSSSIKKKSEMEDYSLDNWEHQLRNPPPLTSIGRERVSTEIILLESLENNNEAVSELWNLWYNSRGPEAATLLEETDLLISGGPAYYNEAEKKLRSLIDKEGVYFVEAVNRLATLLFFQRRFRESRTMCKLVLAVKPWHFGALSGIVMVCQRLNDKEGMIQYASLRLPPIDQQQSSVSIGTSGEQITIKTRKQWISFMVNEAKEFQLLNEKLLETSFQDLDNNNNDDDNDDDNEKDTKTYNSGISGVITEDDDEGSWQ